MIPYFEQLQLDLGGGVVLYGYTLMQVLSQLVAMGVVVVLARLRGLSMWPLLAVWTIAPLAGAAAGHWVFLVLYDAEGMVADPLKLVRFWEGMSSVGYAAAMIPVAALTLGLASMRDFRRLPPMLDVYGISLAASWVVARMGCFMSHDHVGAQTTFFLGVQGICALPDGGYRSYLNGRVPPEVAELACHDLGLYEALAVGLILAGMIAVFSSARRPGLAASLGLIAFAFVKPGLHLLRDTHTHMESLPQIVATSGTCVVLGVAGWVLLPVLTAWAQRIAMASQPLSEAPTPADH